MAILVRFGWLSGHLFGFEGGIRVLIVQVAGHCGILVTFSYLG